MHASYTGVSISHTACRTPPQPRDHCANVAPCAPRFVTKGADLSPFSTSLCASRRDSRVHSIANERSSKRSRTGSPTWRRQRRAYAWEHNFHINMLAKRSPTELTVNETRHIAGQPTPRRTAAKAAMSRRVLSCLQKGGVLFQTSKRTHKGLTRRRLYGSFPYCRTYLI